MLFAIGHFASGAKGVAEARTSLHATLVIGRSASGVKRQGGAKVRSRVAALAIGVCASRVKK